MGMYTELIFGASLKENTPEEVIETLKNMCGLESKTNILNLGRNPFYTQSYYFGVHRSKPFMEYDGISKNWVISTRGNIKNYNNEIETFLEWIKPYIENGSGSRDMYAIVTYEESEEPTIYYLYDE